jgi:hypothetical protein
MPVRTLEPRMERRTFLWLPGAVAAATWLGLVDDLVADTPASTLSFEDFCKEVGGRALALIGAEDRNEDAYLHEVSALAARSSPAPEAALGKPFKGIIRTGLNYRGSGIVVVQWSMEAGLSYPAHNHPHYTGITVGLEGDCRIRTFDPVDALPPRDSTAGFQVRETQDQLLEPRRIVSIMSTTHNNIHTLRTGARAVRGIDVMTLVGKHEGFSFVEIDDASRDGAGVFAARWGESLAR